MKKLVNRLIVVVLMLTPLHLVAEECGSEYIATITFKRTEVVTHTFSVSQSKSVLFAPGNLKYDIDNNSWGFISPQYDYYRQSRNENNNPTTGVIDMFAYGTSGFDGKSPVMTNTADDCWANVNISGTNYDWGVYNAVNGDQAGTWRTLTNDEWEYVFNRASGQLQSGARVEGIYGLVILPDDWVLPSGLTFTARKSFQSVNGENVNVYSATQWSQMESAGAVFLPAAGAYYGQDSRTDNASSYCVYMTSTQESNTRFKRVDFGNGDDHARPGNNVEKHFRCAVRLVRNVN